MQGYVLAPHLFNLFISDLSINLNAINSHSPYLGTLALSHLAHADDIVLVSLTKIGLTRILTELAQFFFFFF